MQVDLSGRTALVTGSTSGIGTAVATALAAANATVVIHGRSENRLQTAMQKAGTAHGVVADISTTDGCTSLYQETVRLIGSPDILINNAGVIQQAGPYPAIQEIEDLLAVNAWSGFRLARACLPTMLRENNHGRIIWISSLAARAPDPLMLPYTVSKAVQLYLSDYFASLAKGTTVTSTAILPGLTATPGAEGLLCARHQTIPAEAWRRGAQEHATLRPGLTTPDEIASVVAFLATPAAGVLQRSAILLDGGETPLVLS